MGQFSGGANNRSSVVRTGTCPAKITLIIGVAALTHHRRDGDSRSAGLQLETLGSTELVCTRRAPTGRQQLD